MSMAIVNIKPVFGVRQVLLINLLKASRSPVPGIALPYTIEGALNEAVRQRWNLDYVQGRSMKCDLSRYEVDTYCYDRDNGQGKFLQCVSNTIQQVKEESTRLIEQERAERRNRS